MKKKRSVKKLNDCLKCEHHKGKQGSLITCDAIKDVTVMVLSKPSHYNEGFQNGVVVVECCKEQNMVGLV